jgi:AraC-like DNA-binding protein
MTDRTMIDYVHRQLEQGNFVNASVAVNVVLNTQSHNELEADQSAVALWQLAGLAHGATSDYSSNASLQCYQRANKLARRTGDPNLLRRTRMALARGAGFAGDPARAVKILATALMSKHGKGSDKLQCTFHELVMAAWVLRSASLPDGAIDLCSHLLSLPDVDVDNRCKALALLSALHSSAVECDSFKAWFGADYLATSDSLMTYATARDRLEVAVCCDRLSRSLADEESHPNSHLVRVAAEIGLLALQSPDLIPSAGSADKLATLRQKAQACGIIEQLALLSEATLRMRLGDFEHAQRHLAKCAEFAAASRRVERQCLIHYLRSVCFARLRVVDRAFASYALHARSAMRLVGENKRASENARYLVNRIVNPHNRKTLLANRLQKYATNAEIRTPTTDAISEFAREEGLTRRTVDRVARSVLGQSSRELLEAARLDRAYQYLQNTPNASYKRAASLSGFRTYSTFYRAFKRRYGRAPSTPDS